MESIHYGIICQKCQVFPITGIRYKCLKCDNYDLCEYCEKIFGKEHGHPLLKLRNTNQTNMYENKYNKKDYKLKQVKKPNTSNPTFKCINSTLNFKTINNNNFINIPIKLLNNGNIKWPLPCYFKCQDELSDIKGKRVKITKASGEPWKDVEFNVKIDLSNINKSGH